MSSLAAARADNFYYPPEWDPKKGSLNKFQGQHPLRERARKLDQGILIIRFEMPFNVWCGGCSSMIAKGVRFNAEKKQIGNYYTTKIWSFKMKSACCQHQIEIHTDPKSCEYIVVSGAEKKTVEYDAAEAGTILLPDPADKAKLDDPFAKLEHVEEDIQKAKESEKLLIRLQRESDLKHADNYSVNKLLRAKLRDQKKRVKCEEVEARRLGLGIRLLPKSDSDVRGAAKMHFASKFEDNRKNKRARIEASSIFSRSNAYAGGCEEEDRRFQLLVKRKRIHASEAQRLLCGKFKRASHSVI